MSALTPGTFSPGPDDEALQQMQIVYDSERVRALEEMRQAYSDAVEKVLKLSFTHESL